ncbi:MAG TPA: efflux transporter outer membrane subunit [Steroidobacteraceae bacterium]|nr:efflux transporter outer membrane subunit [Steroidobacteraceae bacterium]
MSTRNLPACLAALLAAAGLVLGGCVAHGDWKPAPQLAPASLAAERTLAGAPLDATAWPGDGWWRGYGDPQLDALVGEALAGSPSLAIAEARLRAAQAQALVASAPLLPQAALDAEVTRQRYPQNGLYPPPFAGSYSTDGRIAADFSYDIDFWGRNRTLLAAARSGVQVADADRAAARLALAVAVVRAYVQLDLAYQLLDVANDNLAQQNSILELTQQRVSAGLENQARVKQSEGMVALTRAGVAAAHANIELARNQLAALIGAGPDRGQSLARPQLAAPSGIALPSRLPVDLLGRRPDVAAARAEVQQAAHGVRAAEADFYPNVNLMAFAGLQSIGLAKLFDASDRILGAGPALSLPVFNRRQLRGALAAREAQFDESVGRYNQTLIDAVHDVADVVANWQALERESSEQQTALAAAQRAYDLTTERYRAGLDNYLSVLSSENQVLLTQALRAELKARALTFSVDLVRALGGGYAPAAPPA